MEVATYPKGCAFAPGQHYGPKVFVGVKSFHQLLQLSHPSPAEGILAVRTGELNQSYTVKNLDVNRRRGFDENRHAEIRQTREYYIAILYGPVATMMKEYRYRNDLNRLE